MHGPVDLDAVLDMLQEDHKQWEDAPALQLEYGGKRDLKPTPKVFRNYLQQWMEMPWDKGAMVATSYASELVTDGTGKSVKPTALHFTSGKQLFLDAVINIHGFVDRPRLRAVLMGGAVGEKAPKALNWDGVTRDYALRASDPSKEKLVVPAAEWLGFRGITLFPTAPRGARLKTACILGTWNYGEFRWPLWRDLASIDAIRSLLTTSRLAVLTAQERDQRGLCAVFSANISRNGKYGAFSPSRAASRSQDPYVQSNSGSGSGSMAISVSTRIMTKSAFS
jgi:hypothetical protein